MSSLASLSRSPPRRLGVVVCSAIVLISLLILLSTDAGSQLFPGSKLIITSPRKSPIDPVHNATLGFEKVFAINLPERTDHRDGLVLAAAVSNINVQYVEGVRGDLPAKILPPVFNSGLSKGSVGSWRAHLNAIRTVVESGVSTALILEDDVDWDVRLRDLLSDFAAASQSLVNLPDSTRIGFRDLPSHSAGSSPYGEGWDLLWLGHCGMSIPEKGARVIKEKDDSVPEVQHLKSHDVNAASPLTRYPQHTRLFLQGTEADCTLAYAVSQKGARAILNDLGINRLDGPFDTMLREWCAGRNGHDPHVCFGALPQLFDHYRRQGSTESDSEISTPSDPYREKAHTLNIRWSVRLNMKKILNGDNDYDDQWPDRS